MTREDVKGLIDEMMELEKSIQDEQARRNAAEEQFFQAMAECDFKKADRCLKSMDDSAILGFQSRFDALKDRARTLMGDENAGGTEKMP
ncbi:MAG: hypothetical protein NC548_39720 [Lachnospiraceae bacterium]|nr:hypothetical protein [Lachnospiraceae bacterium]